MAATRTSKRVEFVVELERWDTARDYDRLGLDDVHHDLLGLRVPKVTMPVAPGRNVAMLVEVAARNQLLRARGVHAARDFVDALDQRLERVGGRASTTPTTATTSTAEARREARPGRELGDPARRGPTSSSSPGCRAPGSRRRSTPSRTWATTASTTCRWRCCRTCTRCTASEEALARVAVVVDIRERRVPHARFPPVFARLRAAADVPPALIFLEASRLGPAPPLQRDAAAASAGARTSRSPTRSRSSGARWRRIRAMADEIVDTSDLTVHELRQVFLGAVARSASAGPRLVLTFESFGFKHGLPLGADLVFDVRFLPNPHFVPELRPQTGRDRAGRRLPRAPAGDRPAARAA